MNLTICKTIFPQLSLFVKKIFILRGEFSQNIKSRVVPTGTLQILILFSKQELVCSEKGKMNINRSQASIIGQRTQYSLFSTEGNVEILGIEFFPHNVSVFFEQPISDFTLKSPLVDDVWKENRLLEKIITASNDLERFNIVQGELIKRIKFKDSFKEESMILYNIINHIGNRGNISIETLGKRFGLHQRKMERMFLRHIGISPISYARILRIEKASRIISEENGFNSLDFALENGFYDQAHFNHDFKTIVGLSPTEFALSLKF